MNINTRSLLFLLYFCFCLTLSAEKIKIACVGNSVTYGYLLEDRVNDSYPAQLQRLLGEEYEVGNFGKSGATLLKNGHRPYIQQEEYLQALAFAGDKVIIHLGLNDTDPRNWPNYRDQFIGDYLQLIQSFRNANPKCEIWICRMTPIAHWHPRFKSGTRDWYWLIQAEIEEIARIAHCHLIDLQEPLYNRPDLLPDALHPNKQGAELLAHTVKSALTGDYGGLHMPPIYSDYMVLQSNEHLTLSGKADAGEKVTVRFAHQKKQTTTSDNGQWSITLEPLAPSSNPEELLIYTSNRKLRYKDVLVGEVWLCSGQSNMAFRVNESILSEQQDHKAYEARKTNHIRLFDMKPRWETYATSWDSSVLDSLNALDYYQNVQWVESNEQNSARFSAIGYAFGRMLSDSLNVPVGLILNAVGGSPTESWIDRKKLEFEFPEILTDWRNNDFIQSWVRERASLNIKLATNKHQRHPYEPCYLFEAGIRPLNHYPIKGIIWYQGESNAHNIEAHERLFLC